jgi:hypothetical protein
MYVRMNVNENFYKSKFLKTKNTINVVRLLKYLIFINLSLGKKVITTFFIYRKKKLEKSINIK